MSFTSVKILFARPLTPGARINYSQDCKPLAPAAEASVSDADLRRIEPLQRALLSPLDHEGIDHWRREVNQAAVTAFGSDAAMFQLDVEGVELQFSDEFKPEDLATYSDEIMATLSRNLRLYQRMREIGAGNRSMLWAADLEWLYGSEYFNELVVPMRAFDPLWVSACAGESKYPATLHTYHDQRTSHHYFDAGDVTLMRAVRPALEAGVRTVMRLQAGRASLTAVLDGRDDGVLVYDIEGRLLHRNPAVGRLVRTARGEASIVDAGGDMARSLAAGEIRDLVRPDSMDRSVSTRGGTYRLHAVLLSAGVFTPAPAVLVTIGAGELPLPDRDTVRDHFGLTRRQAEVALLLARRTTSPEIAEVLCISEHTVRSHVEAVMGRLAVHDRREIGPLLRGRRDPAARSNGDRRP